MPSDQTDQYADSFFQSHATKATVSCTTCQYAKNGRKANARSLKKDANSPTSCGDSQGTARYGMDHPTGVTVWRLQCQKEKEKEKEQASQALKERLKEKGKEKANRKEKASLKEKEKERSKAKEKEKAKAKAKVKAKVKVKAKGKVG